MDVKQWGTPHPNWLIELLLYWEGHINSRALTERFAVTRQTASKWIKAYHAEADLPVDYQASKKAYHAPIFHTPYYISGAIDEYLDWRKLGLFPNRSHDTQVSETQSVTRIVMPRRFVAPEIMRPLIQALDSNAAADANYLSISGSAAQERILYPHTFVKAANRWHVRAYCEHAQGFRDFVLSRFISVDFDGTPATYTAKDDQAWNTPVEIILEPDQRLTAQQKAIIEHDYGMQNGQLVIATTGALVKYTLDDLQIKTKMLEVNPQAQQLVCVNYADIKAWLYD
ncbi:WYL domain-containing protein [Marinomonas ostreistagni]|uniref:WYL domain-containing protein n=1 Tax=Marinomonas ostreistagni TaxID=359209 RepID=UPI00194EB898|nr:WYL domain-containing protein [Marinomonas ostreistagni]MBM6551172.1 WYL domain-containing protein [Marinomonas ostreistagni]